jgi:diaminopimelate decarboxylase
LRAPDGHLLASGIRLGEIAAALGTPAYVYNAEVMRARYAELDEAFAAVPHRIHYAVKANANLAVLRFFRDLGAGADIVSIGEGARCLAAGFAPGDLVFSGVGKTSAELEHAARLDLGSINVESLEELDTLGKIAIGLGKRVRFGIRFNPDVTADTHPYISTGQSGIKFGVPADQVAEAVALVRGHPSLELVTIAIHIGSQILDLEPFRDGARRLADLVTAVRLAGVESLRSVDLGGGVGIRYADETPPSAADFAAAVRPVLAPLGLSIHLEPGRFLVGSAGCLLTRVTYRKQSGGKVFVVVDAGMTELVRPSRYGAYHHIVEVVERPGAAMPADVVGPVCETGDFLAIDRPLPPIAPGDLLAVLGAGAYGFVMGSTYNARPRPPEVLVTGDRWQVVRRRETIEELFTGESVVGTPPASSEP